MGRAAGSRCFRIGCWEHMSKLNNYLATPAPPQQTDLKVLRNAKVVGMTTSGVASMQTLVEALGPKV